MKRISTYIVTLVLALAGSSCSDYLDKEYDASLSEKKVSSSPTSTRICRTDWRHCRTTSSQVLHVTV